MTVAVVLKTGFFYLCVWVWFVSGTNSSCGCCCDCLTRLLRGFFSMPPSVDFEDGLLGPVDAITLY